MPIHIYAEHLINIRTLTIQISLPTSSDASTTLSADGNALALSHQGETAQVTLPVSVPDSERAKLSLPAVPSTTLSFRVRLDDTSSRDSQSGETVIPWAATSLSKQVELQCKSCHAEILRRGQIQTWKDLPSEGWAEMMEFWHCHKPNEPHDHEHQTDKKGYSADSMLAITPSVGLVNATSFVLAADDCKNIKVMEAPHGSEAAAHLKCSSCDAIIGTLDTATSSYKLFKLALSLSRCYHKETFDVTKWLSCHLLNSMDNQGLRKFVVTPSPASQPSLLIWLFAPDLNIASSAAACDTPLRVTKILWKPAPAQRPDVLLDKQSMTEGEIEIPDFEFEALMSSLEQSAVLLPQSAQRFQDWNVALLERFVASDGALQWDLFVASTIKRAREEAQWN